MLSRVESSNECGQTHFLWSVIASHCKMQLEHLINLVLERESEWVSG